MHETLFEGDRIIVNKLSYGARIPITPLSIPASTIFLDWIELPYWRLPGFSTVKRNDVIVFNFPTESDLPADQKKQYVKRCIGLPGDTVQINNGNVSVNRENITEGLKIQYQYILKDDGNLNSLKGLEGFLENNNTHNGYYFLSAQHADSLKYNKDVISLSKQTIEPSVYNPSVFPNSSQLPWNADNFGPLFIPAKGTHIMLNSKNVLLYKLVIEKYERNKINMRNDSVFINDHYRMTYTFKMNYYFALGDNRYNSIDSRFFGFIPEDHLIGKASYILFSNNSRNYLHLFSSIN